MSREIRMLLMVVVFIVGIAAGTYVLFTLA